MTPESFQEMMERAQARYEEDARRILGLAPDAELTREHHRTMQTVLYASRWGSSGWHRLSVDISLEDLSWEDFAKLQ